MSLEYLVLNSRKYSRKPVDTPLNQQGKFDEKDSHICISVCATLYTQYNRKNGLTTQGKKNKNVTLTSKSSDKGLQILQILAQKDTSPLHNHPASNTRDQSDGLTEQPKPESFWKITGLVLPSKM